MRSWCEIREVSWLRDMGTVQRGCNAQGYRGCGWGEPPRYKESIAVVRARCEKVDPVQRAVVVPEGSCSANWRRDLRWKPSLQT